MSGRPCHHRRGRRGDLAPDEGGRRGARGSGGASTAACGPASSTVTLRLSAPGTVAVVVYAFVTTWNALIFALVLAHDYRVKWPPVAILFFAEQRPFVGGLTAGGVKG